MLAQLSIKNIVLIESCELSFERGLCVLSGETGAGKSILLDALGLALGARADASLIRSGEAQGAVTAEFDISRNENAKSVLVELELEPSDTLIIRRSIGEGGKTRTLANDQPITITGLKKLGETLVEIHGQHDQRGLMDATLHRAMLDDFAGEGALRKNVSAAYVALRAQNDAIAALKADIAQTAREQDYLQHMHGELKQLSPKPGEEEELTNRRSSMMQSEKLYELLNGTIGELTGGKGVIASLGAAQRLLTRSPLSQGEALRNVVEMLERAAIEVDEALVALEEQGRSASYDPEELERIEERLFALKAAARKYNLPLDELPNLHQQVKDKLALLASQSARLQTMEKNVALARKHFLDVAGKLSELRAKASGKLEKLVEKELAPLKMEGTRFRVRIEPLAEANWSGFGIDAVHFECATNVTKGTKDIAYAPLSKIASGGELSRFMLALKVSLSSVRSAPTLIFDEIDTGTGGAVADAIGVRLATLGKSAQVLVVTHLPQVAARGSQHMLVAKEMKAKRVTTSVRSLLPTERAEELARMLAGATITPEARKAAQKLLEQAA